MFSVWVIHSSWGFQSAEANVSSGFGEVDLSQVCLGNFYLHKAFQKEHFPLCRIMCVSEVIRSEYFCSYTLHDGSPCENKHKLVPRLSVESQVERLKTQRKYLHQIKQNIDVTLAWNISARFDHCVVYLGWCSRKFEWLHTLATLEHWKFKQMLTKYVHACGSNGDNWKWRHFVACHLIHWSKSNFCQACAVSQEHFDIRNKSAKQIMQTTRFTNVGTILPKFKY